MNEIALNGVSSLNVRINPEAIETRNKILDETKLITKISSDAIQNVAVDTLREAKLILKGMESTRKDCKKPVLEIGKKIDSLAVEFSEPLELECKRIEKMLASYEELKRIKLEHERLAAEIELKRIEELKRQQDCENHKKLAAAHSEILQADTPEQKIEAQQKLNNLTQRMQEQAIELKNEVNDLLPNKSDKVKGQTIKEVWKFEVLDIVKLARFNLDLVKIEPSVSAINSAIKNGMTNIPGLKIWKETEVNVRSL